ncbi:MAG TPA: HAD-IIB family hydrolase [Roseiflexaceae bacterium]|nr:HAD-IIB family hydrolase [Roseiflexaceae bacterium]
MRYFALATDYDGTLAHDGLVNDETIAALEQLRATGRKLILVTGRELDDLLRVFPRLELFDRVVAENGALIYTPATREARPLGDPPPEAFVAALQAQGVAPLSVGRVIVATWHPNETVVLKTIRDLGLEHQVIFNKGAVMVLPPSINKAAGLGAALSELGLSPHNVVGVGDAENDHAFMSICECSVAVANALPMVKERADYVTRGDHGAGVSELIEIIVANDLRELQPRIASGQILLGTRVDARGAEVLMAAYGVNLLLTGSSGAGKSTLATAVLERLAAQGYQFCIIDPEGDYEAFEGAVTLGDPNRDPSPDAVIELMETSSQNVIVNLLGIALQHRPAFFEQLLPRIQELRARTGRPHWLVIDEAHHLLPTSWRPSPSTLPQELSGLLLITVHPDHVAPAVLSLINTIITVGESPEKGIGAFAEALGQAAPDIGPLTLDAGEALVWSRAPASDTEPGDSAPFRLRIAPASGERRRHSRKYAEGSLGEDKSFYFRGPEQKLNLRAQNLILFTQLAEGVDDETWLYHLRQGDYSRWFRESIKDHDLAAEVERFEQQENDAAESRAAIKAAIEERYTAPA